MSELFKVEASVCIKLQHVNKYKIIDSFIALVKTNPGTAKLISRVRDEKIIDAALHLAKPSTPSDSR